MQLILFLLVTYIIFIRIVKIKLKKHFLCLHLIFGKLYITRDKRNFIILLKCYINVRSASGATDKTGATDRTTGHFWFINFFCKTGYPKMSQKANYQKMCMLILLYKRGAMDRTQIFQTVDMSVFAGPKNFVSIISTLNYRKFINNLLATKTSIKTVFIDITIRLTSLCYISKLKSTILITYR